MKTRNFLAALLLMVAGLQTAWAQGFRVYQSDGTQFNFSLKTDSIVFDNGLSGDQVFGPFTPVNQCIVGTWQWGGSTVTFNADGTTDFNEGSTYEFMPYQGIIIIYNASGNPSTALFVYKVTSEEMYTNATNMSRVNVWTRVHQEGQPVTGITLSATTLSLQPGQTAQLTAAVSPADAENTSVTWQSLDELVATVSSTGLVTGVANGSTKILCSANDGSGVVAECQVTVGNSSGTPVTSITLSQTTLSLAVGSTQTLTATVLPTNATNKSVAWTSSNTSVATVDTGKNDERYKKGYILSGQTCETIKVITEDELDEEAASTLYSNYCDLRNSCYSGKREAEVTMTIYSPDNVYIVSNNGVQTA